MATRETGLSFRTLDWDGSAVVAIDQTLLPHEEVFLRIQEVEDLAEAIT